MTRWRWYCSRPNLNSKILLPPVVSTSISLKLNLASSIVQSHSSRFRVFSFKSRRSSARVSHEMFSRMQYGSSRAWISVDWNRWNLEEVRTLAVEKPWLSVSGRRGHSALKHVGNTSKYRAKHWPNIAWRALRVTTRSLLILSTNLSFSSKIHGGWRISDYQHETYTKKVNSQVRIHFLSIMEFHLWIYR